MILESVDFSSDELMPEFPRLNQATSTDSFIPSGSEVFSGHDSEIIREARRLYDIEMNVLPLKPGSKHRFDGSAAHNWGRLQREKLSEVFGGTLDVNLGVLCGKTSDNLFSVDCDTPETFAWVGAELRQRGINTWVRTSDRGGHYMFRCAEGSIQYTHQRGYEILGEGRVVTMPPSVSHESGEMYYWKEQPEPRPALVGVADLPFLPLKVAQYHRLPREKSRMPPVANAVLVERNLQRYNGDNSRAEFASCLSLIGAGWTRSEIIALFRQVGPPHYKKVGEENWTKYILGDAYAKSRETISREIQPVVDAYRMRLDHHPFAGQKGNSERCVLDAMAQRMLLDGDTQFRATFRELEALSGLSSATVQAAVRRVIAAGYVQKVPPVNEQGGSSRYALVLDAVGSNALPTQNTRVNERLPVSSITRLPRGVDPLSHDVWHARGLGKSAHAVFSWLIRHPDSSVPEIVTAIGKVKNTVRTALKKMAAHGLVVQDDLLWSVSLDADNVDLGKVAYYLGTSGKLSAKKLRHQAEREAWLTTQVLSELVRYAEYSAASAAREAIGYSSINTTTQVNN